MSRARRPKRHTAPKSAAGVPLTRESPSSAPERRTLLLRLWGLLGLATLGELVWVTLSFLRPRAKPDDSAGIVVAGPVERFEPGSVTAFPGGKFYLVHLLEGGFLALHRQCTHLGCSVPWMSESGRFQCPCHASSFDITGAVIGPPATRPLDTFPVRIENRIVKVDTRQRRRRSAFDASQVTRS